MRPREIKQHRSFGRERKVVQHTSFGHSKESLENLKWIRDYYKKKEGFIIEDVQIYERALKELREKLEEKEKS